MSFGISCRRKTSQRAPECVRSNFFTSVSLKSSSMASFVSLLEVLVPWSTSMSGASESILASSSSSLSSSAGDNVGNSPFKLFFGSSDASFALYSAEAFGIFSDLVLCQPFNLTSFVCTNKNTYYRMEERFATQFILKMRFRTKVKEPQPPYFLGGHVWSEIWFTISSLVAASLISLQQLRHKSYEQFEQCR
nr:hypothetical protein Iba_chr06bCG4790 [Ipomoea batatas]